MMAVSLTATNSIEGVAQKLADGLGADIYEITSERSYTEEELDYNNSESRSSVEMNDLDSCPDISSSVENMGQFVIDSFVCIAYYKDAKNIKSHAWEIMIQRVAYKTLVKPYGRKV